ncbi:lipid asymmetry maintenance protein MlaB [Dechloromonas denitrificans]|uniref:STAS domain-containing protein n=1 Tax=Dechloromonas denitrificans TaxID=281362 RepID=UPI001CF8BA10|nr:STAS domain-containing protein [Dechloromonas denitrificans]UCV05028.1 STAS domain-containing protein [Dechloromonas denitrificans]
MADMPEAVCPALAIAGEFTIFTASTLKEQILQTIRQAEMTEVEIDLSNVTEIDSAGLQLMILAKIEALGRGKNIHFTRHSDPVLDLIDLCDLAGFFGDPVLIRSKN